MDYRPLGRTGVSLSVLGLGCSPLGGTFGEIMESEGIHCVHSALDRGVNYLDVAPAYGASKAETVLGKALQGISRERYFLSTKVGKDGRGNWDFSALGVKRSVDASLSRLGCGHIDLILCHDIEFVPLRQVIEEALPTLKDLQREGKVRFVGFSGLPLAIFPMVIDNVPTGTIDAVITYCHYTLSDTSLDTLLPYLHAKGIGVINAAALGMGLLTTQQALPDWHPASPELRAISRSAATACTLEGADIADLGLQFAMSHPSITSTLVGSSKASEVIHNASLVGTTPNPRLLQKVRQVLQSIRDLSWPSGLPENDPAHH